MGKSENAKILKEAQEKMLDILIEVDTVCKNNNIKYWLDSGTLLGAIRHKGFIPWDDDIDICMLKEDYERFLKIAPIEMDITKYFLSTIKTDPDTVTKFSKVRNRNSIFLEKEDTLTERFHQGIYIDVFPMVYLKQRVLYLQFLYKILIRLKDCPLTRGNNKFLKSVFHGIKIPYICEKIFNMLFVSRKETEIIGYKYNFNNIFFYKDIFPLKKIKFEDHFFYSPYDADRYLTTIYKNYMELPPEEERTWHSKEIRFNERCYFEQQLEKTGNKLYKDLE